jgi:hypothetical protein
MFRIRQICDDILPVNKQAVTARAPWAAMPGVFFKDFLLR